MKCLLGVADGDSNDFVPFVYMLTTLSDDYRFLVYDNGDKIILNCSEFKDFIKYTDFVGRTHDDSVVCFSNGLFSLFDSFLLKSDWHPRVDAVVRIINNIYIHGLNCHIEDDKLWFVNRINEYDAMSFKINPDKTGAELKTCILKCNMLDNLYLTLREDLGYGD